MTEQRHDGQTDIVDEAIDALRQSPVPAGPCRQTLARTLAAVRAAQSAPPRRELIERIKTMKPWIRRAVAAVLVAGVLAAGWYTLFHDSRGSMAFADVKRNMQEAQSYSFTVTTPVLGQQEAMTVRILYKAPGLLRQEAGDGDVVIVRLREGKGLVLSSDTKVALVLNLGEMPEHFQGALGEDPVTRMNALLEENPQDLGERQIDGVTAKGYRVSKAGASMDVWMDPETGLPVLVEMQSTMFEGTSTLSDFQLNLELDDELFSLAVPEGYKVHEQAVNLNMGDLTEEDLVKGLGLLAEYNDGVFPKGPAINQAIVDNMGKAEVSKDQAYEFPQQFARMVVFMTKIVSESTDFQYVGKGVKLGDKDTPIMWWKPKGAEEYRVVYGDLRIEDVQPADLPSAVPAAEPDQGP